MKWEEKQAQARLNQLGRKRIKRQRKLGPTTPAQKPRSVYAPPPPVPPWMLAATEVTCPTCLATYVVHALYVSAGTYLVCWRCGTKVGTIEERWERAIREAAHEAAFGADSWDFQFELMSLSQRRWAGHAHLSNLTAP